MDIAQRRFGFELEVGQGRLRNLNNRVESAGLKKGDTGTHDYHCGCPTCTEEFYWPSTGEIDLYENGDASYRGWPVKVQYDSSCGAEVITAPIRWGDPRWRDMCSKLEDILNRQPPIETNESCSFHVHVECQDLSTKELANLARLMYSNEAVLFRLASQSDKHRGQLNNYRYCLPFSAFEGGDYADRDAYRSLDYALATDPTVTEVGGTKYVALNFRPRERQGTVEFRLYDVVRTAWQMEFLVDLSVAMVQRAKKKPVAKSKGGTLGRYTRTKGEVKGKTAATHLLNKVSQVIPAEHKLVFTQRFWQMFEGKKWQPSWAELTRLQPYADPTDAAPVRRRRNRRSQDGWFIDDPTPPTSAPEPLPNFPALIFRSLEDLEDLGRYQVRINMRLAAVVNAPNDDVIDEWLVAWEADNYRIEDPIEYRYIGASEYIAQNGYNLSPIWQWLPSPNVGPFREDSSLAEWCGPERSCDDCNQRWVETVRTWARTNSGRLNLLPVALGEGEWATPPTSSPLTYTITSNTTAPTSFGREVGLPGDVTLMPEDGIRIEVNEEELEELRERVAANPNVSMHEVEPDRWLTNEQVEAQMREYLDDDEAAAPLELRRFPLTASRALGTDVEGNPSG